MFYPWINMLSGDSGVEPLSPMPAEGSGWRGMSPWDGDERGQNGIKPNALNVCVINEIDQEQAEQTHREYFLTLQQFRSPWRPDLREI